MVGRIDVLMMQLRWVSILQPENHEYGFQAAFLRVGLMNARCATLSYLV